MKVQIEDYNMISITGVDSDDTDSAITADDYRTLITAAKSNRNVKVVNDLGVMAGFCYFTVVSEVDTVTLVLYGVDTDGQFNTAVVTLDDYDADDAEIAVVFAVAPVVAGE